MDRNTLPENPMISIDVALRKESVDRNMEIGIRPFGVKRRSPQGERG